MNQKIFYTSEELLEIFKEQHRLCSPLGPNWVYRRPIHTGDIQTFRDLVEKIRDNEKLGITAHLQ